MLKLVINADDYGLRESCSLAIIESFHKGYISNTTMCANGVYFKEAVKLAKEYKMISHIGIHLNLTEGFPVTTEIKNDFFFCNEKGEFRGNINRYKPLSSNQKKLLYNELNAQIVKLKENGISISHADSHHHIHTGIFLLPVISKVLRDHGIRKIRLHRNIGAMSVLKRIGKWGYNLILKYIYHFETLQYFGDFADIQSLSAGDKIGSLEIMVHPEYDIEGHLINRTIYDGFPDGDEMKFVVECVKNQFQVELQAY